MKINGTKLANARAKAGMKRTELALVADLTHVRIWQLETEEESHINSNVAKAIAKALKVKLEELV